ncbi:hypothetical protein HC030_11210 [Planosporangium mesophilum]|nr:hypothetical protein [Planosporangium mesophilum]
MAASWSTGYGDVSTTVAALPVASTSQQRLVLAAALTALSGQLWRCYTHPASASPTLEINSDGWRRQQQRDSFAAVVNSVRRPNLPDEHGTLTVSYDPVEECAHRVGRALHVMTDETLTAAVAADLEAEIAAVGQAERGDLSDRARQAVELTRAAPSPTQVAEADGVLSENPLAWDRLFLDFDPAAAAVAAAHWLRAAAGVVSEASGIAVTEVLTEADNIEALPHETPTVVLELLDSGVRPYDAVSLLIREAMLVAEGEVPDLGRLRDAIDKVDRLVGEHAADGLDAAEYVATVRLTPLDPRRPARDLLEDLLTGVQGCRLLYGEYADLDDAGDDDGLEELIDEAFCREVRKRAVADKHRLL